MDVVQRQLHARYGPLVRISPNEVSCADPDAIPKIYPNHRPLQKTDFYPIWGRPSISNQPDSFTCTDERVHSQYRRIVNPVYTLSNVLKSEEYLDGCINLFIERLGEYADVQKAIDLGHWLQMFAFDVIGEIFFGRMFGFMEESHDHESLIASLDTLMPPLCVMAIAPVYLRPFILISSLFIPGARKSGKAVGIIEEKARICVAERLGHIQDGLELRNDLLSHLLQIRDEKGEKINFSTNEVILESWIAILAGSDSTAIALRAVFYFLMKTPAAYKRAQEEIDAAVARRALSSPVKYAEALKLPFLCACIKEAMRLHPSVGLSLQRYAPTEGISLCGTLIPKGYRVGVNAAVVQQDTSTFGADAHEYKPQRWLTGDEDVRALERAMLIFGAGTRTCLGKNISIAEIYKLMPEVLRHFALELAHSQPWKTNNRWFNKQSNIVVRLKRRVPG